MKPAAFLFPVDDHGQGRGLDPSAGCFAETAKAGVVAGQSPGGIDADEPVGLGAAQGGVLQREHFVVIAQVGQAIADGIQGHGLEPEALNFLAFNGAGGSQLDDVFEDQFTFAAGIAGIDNYINITAADEFAQGIEL